MPLDLQNSSIADKMQEIAANGPDRTGLCLPPSLVGNQRALVTPSFRLAVILKYVAASNALVLARQNLYGSPGLGQSGANLGFSGNTTNTETNFDKSTTGGGVPNTQCAWFSDGIMIAVEQGLSIGVTATLGGTVVKDAGSGTGDAAVVLANSATLANYDQFTSQIVQLYFANTQVSYKAEDETCSYLAGTQLANPSSVGMLDGSIPANGNPIKGSYQAYTHAIVEHPTGNTAKPLQTHFQTNRIFAVPFDATAAANALPKGIGGVDGGLSDGDLVYVGLRVMLPGRYSLQSGHKIVSGQAPDPNVDAAIARALAARGL